MLVTLSLVAGLVATLWEARVAERRQFGNAAQLQESSREAWG